MCDVSVEMGGGMKNSELEKETQDSWLYSWVHGEQSWTERRMGRKENMGNRNHGNRGRKASRVSPCLWAGHCLTRVLNL